ncbi:hypothetical protein CICLE_v10024012mg [Citrus x clementina]|uniref:Uncharacterized protein n=2 Tax=Citrus TaxID=2706 RepID=A0ACB8MTT3_CITSI|nr:hypothetical protein CICLE_v10024012mg [Citrus x clementina]KAH9788560.1 hypothetical protein KPL71_010923 [Citrus sinensis]
MDAPTSTALVTRAAGPRKWLGLNIGEGCSPRFPNKANDRPPARTRLNPCAKEWNPFKERAPEEDRCLFLTFSNGYPLAENQIVTFFTNKFGPCVEKVYVHSPEPTSVSEPPLFGKVVFTASYIPAVILCGAKQTKFMVDGKPLWCKKFEPKKKQALGHG